MLGEWMTPSPNPLPQGGEGFTGLSPLPVGEGWVRALLSPYAVLISISRAKI
jgi:hypothetical protein